MMRTLTCPWSRSPCSDKRTVYLGVECSHVRNFAHGEGGKGVRLGYNSLRARRAAAAEERQHAVAAVAEAEAAAEAAEGALAERRRALRAEADVTVAMEADSADAAAAGFHRTAHTFRAAQKTPPVRDPSDALDAALSAAMHAASLPLRVGVPAARWR